MCCSLLFRCCVFWKKSVGASPDRVFAAPLLLHNESHCLLSHPLPFFFVAHRSIQPPIRYPEIRDSLRVTEDDLFYGGSFADAQLLVKKGTGSQFSFRFFVQQTVWAAGSLEEELNDGVWLPAACAKETILKIREREGGRRPKPFWTDVMELVGGDYGEIMSDLYERSR